MNLLPYGFIVACALGFGCGVIIANGIWRRQEERRREEALEPFLQDIEAIDLPGPWISLGDAANNAVRAAAILRENSSPQSHQAAAE